MLTMHQAVKVCSQVKLAPYSPFVFQIEDCFADLETNIDAAPITGTRPGRPLRGGAGDWTLDIMYKKTSKRQARSQLSTAQKSGESGIRLSIS